MALSLSADKDTILIMKIPSHSHEERMFTCSESWIWDEASAFPP